MREARIGRIEVLDYAGTEALNAICSNLSFAGRNLRKILLTSATAGEGKSFLTMQIAQNLAKRGKSVCVVDADLRRSFMTKRYEMTTNGEWVGLAHYLAGYNDLDDVIYQTNLYQICMIPVGRDVSNPVPLLDTPNFAEMLNTLAENFDLVLVDAPPVGLVIDAAEIAQETIANGRLIPRLCFRNEQKQPVASKEENPFYSRQRKVALRNVGQIDPSSLA